MGNPDFYSPARDPSRLCGVYSSAFRCGGKRVSKSRFIVEVRHGHATGSIHEHRTVCETDTSARGKEPVCAHDLINSERRWSAAGISCCAALRGGQAHAAEIGFEAEQQTVTLIVIASLGAAREAIACQLLLAGGCDCRHARGGKIARRTKDCAGLCVRFVVSATAVGAYVKPFEVVGRR